jgi:hypothetical protein
MQRVTSGIGSDFAQQMDYKVIEMEGVRIF